MTAPDSTAPDSSPPAAAARPCATPADLFARLRALGVEVSTHEHEAVFTVEESRHLRGLLPGWHSKNLFLRNKKGQAWLVVCEEERRVDLKALGELLGAGRLSFGSPDRLMEALGVTPGSVTPFAIINDDARQVTIALDADMMRHGTLHFHPLVNTMTTAIAPAGLLSFIASCGHEPHIVDLDSVTLPAEPATVTPPAEDAPAGG
ncbi:prolyl-tRNA synthetase associated domain-containing protein [Inquilinus sp. YAF38]|uniref:prolyl-tRNA synthetase associated domain-containing protein n=1 Tax=Inquilinus sp. YAF38 TaxID=3233084 RepID=UPI003F92D6BD